MGLLISHKINIHSLGTSRQIIFLINHEGYKDQNRGWRKFFFLHQSGNTI